MARILNQLSQALITAYDKDYTKKDLDTISVNPVVAELASWYEKFRTAMEYREDEVILRAAIERILKRRVLLGGSAENVAAPLIRELIWARYFPDSTISESVVARVSAAIDLYLNLEQEINNEHHMNRSEVNEWIYQLLSSKIEDILKPSPEKEIMCNFMFTVFKNRVNILDDSEEARDVQVFIAVRRAYANEDVAILRFALFTQYFGQLNNKNLEKVARNFLAGFHKINDYLKYAPRDKILNYIKNQTIPFAILSDVLMKNKGRNYTLFSDQDQLNLEIVNVCNSRYAIVVKKVGRAILRSVIFILFTKAVFAFFIESTIDRLLLGRVVWSSITLNTLTPPLLMALVGFFIETPNRDNSLKIMQKINSILFDENPNLNPPLNIKKKSSKSDPILKVLFILLWLLTFALSLGAVIFVLTKLRISPVSQAIFIFFLAIVSFLSYRIQRTANMYILKDTKEGLGSLVFDFFFMPFIYSGRRLTTAISQLNIILFVFDYIIEAPFKGIVSFFEQWLLFLRTQREKLD